MDKTVLLLLKMDGKCNRSPEKTPHRNGSKCHPVLMLDKIKVKNL